MAVKLLSEQHLEFLSFSKQYMCILLGVSLKGSCTGSPESTLVQCHIVGNHMSRLTRDSRAIRLELTKFATYQRTSIAWITEKNYKKFRSCICVSPDQLEEAVYSGFNLIKSVSCADPESFARGESRS